MLVGQHGTLELEGQTVGDVVRNLISVYPAIGSHLFGDGEQLHSWVNIFVDQQNIRDLNQLETPMAPNQTLLILTALAGG